MTDQEKKDRARQWRKENAEKVRAYRKKWKADNLEAWKKSKRQWYYRHRLEQIHKKRVNAALGRNILFKRVKNIIDTSTEK